jgi:hypothetical protein
VAMALQARMQPYQSDMTNMVEGLALVTGGVTLLGGQFVVLDTLGGAGNASAAVGPLASAVLLSANILFLGVAVALLTTRGRAFVSKLIRHGRRRMNHVIQRRLSNDVFPNVSRALRHFSTRMQHGTGSMELAPTLGDGQKPEQSGASGASSDDIDAAALASPAAPAGRRASAPESGDSPGGGTLFRVRARQRQRTPRVAPADAPLAPISPHRVRASPAASSLAAAAGVSSDSFTPSRHSSDRAAPHSNNSASSRNGAKRRSIHRDRDDEDDPAPAVVYVRGGVTRSSVERISPRASAAGAGANGPSVAGGAVGAGSGKDRSSDSTARAVW